MKRITARVRGVLSALKRFNYPMSCLVLLIMMIVLNAGIFGQSKAKRTINTKYKKVERPRGDADIMITSTSNTSVLQNALVVPGTGITITSFTLTGADSAAGTYTVGPLGINNGIILASGNVLNALPPDDAPNTTTEFGLPGDPLADSLAGFPTFDAARIDITFDVDDSTNGVSFQFIFGSEEYPEFVGTQFNDVFGTFLNGVQIAFDENNAPITINGPFFSGPNVVIPPTNGLEYDGSTARLQTQAPVTPGSSNTLIFLIADAGDFSYDSGVLLASLQGLPDTTVIGTNFPPQIFCPDSLMVFAGDPLTFNITAQDTTEAGDVTLSSGTLPAGASMNPPLPALGNPVTSAFSWTPNSGQVGEHIVTFTALDSNQLTVSCNVVITVKPQGQEMDFLACLTGDQEVPPVMTNASGGGMFTLNSTQDSLFFNVSVLNLSGPLTAAHFHNAPTGVNGGVVRNITGDFSGTVASGVWTSSDPQPLTPALVAELLAGNIYVNAHTAANPGGEIRGQVTSGMSVALFAVLDGNQEVPPVVTTGNGSGTFLLSGDGSALDFNVTVAGLSSPMTAAHFHNAPAGVNGGVRRTITGDFVGNTATGTWSESDPEPLTPALVAELLAGKIYVNVHTTQHPSGEIRGQVLKNAPPVCNITPGTSFNIFVGQFLTFDVTATDPDPNDLLTLDLFPGDVLPAGATMTPILPLLGLSPVSSTFEWTPAVGQEGIYLFGYMITDSLGNQSFCKVDITVNPDTIPPSCQLTNIDPGPPFTVEVTIQDGESGVAAINIVFVNNAIVTIPPFTPGTTSPIIVTFEKIDQTQSATVVLEVVDGAGNTTLCDPVYQTISAVIPGAFALKQNYPNPFNPTTTIHFDVAASGSGASKVSLKIYDVTGREVKTLINEDMQPGKYSVEWNATNNHGNTVAGGVYIYRMRAGDFVQTRKMILLK